MAALDPAAVADRLRATARDLVALVGSARPARLRRPPAPGQWAPATVVTHMADAELVYSLRFRLPLTSERPFLPAFDEEAWVRRFDELESEPRDALARWRVLREANLRLLESLDADEWQLSGVLGNRGEQTLAQLASLLVDHDRQHLDQIRSGLADV